MTTPNLPPDEPPPSAAPTAAVGAGTGDGPAARGAVIGAALLALLVVGGVAAALLIPTATAATGGASPGPDVGLTGEFGELGGTDELDASLTADGSGSPGRRMARPGPGRRTRARRRHPARRHGRVHRPTARSSSPPTAARTRTVRTDDDTARARPGNSGARATCRPASGSSSGSSGTGDAATAVAVRTPRTRVTGTVTALTGDTATVTSRRPRGDRRRRRGDPEAGGRLTSSCSPATADGTTLSAEADPGAADRRPDGPGRGGGRPGCPAVTGCRRRARTTDAAAAAQGTPGAGLGQPDVRRGASRTRAASSAVDRVAADRSPSRAYSPPSTTVAHVEQVHRAGQRDAQRPARRGERGGPAGRSSSSTSAAPAARSSASCPAACSRQPRPPQLHAGPSGSTTTCPSSPARPPAPAEQLAAEHDPGARRRCRRRRARSRAGGPPPNHSSASAARSASLPAWTASPPSRAVSSAPTATSTQRGRFGRALQPPVGTDHAGQRHAGARDRQPGLGDDLGGELGGPVQPGGRRPVAVRRRRPSAARAPRRTGRRRTRPRASTPISSAEPGRPGPVELQRVGRPPGAAAGGRQLGDAARPRSAPRPATTPCRGSSPVRGRHPGPGHRLAAGDLAAAPAPGCAAARCCCPPPGRRSPGSPPAGRARCCA